MHCIYSKSTFNLVRIEFGSKSMLLSVQPLENISDVLRSLADEVKEISETVIEYSSTFEETKKN